MRVIKFYQFLLLLVLSICLSPSSAHCQIEGWDNYSSDEQDLIVTLAGSGINVDSMRIMLNNSVPACELWLNRKGWTYAGLQKSQIEDSVIDAIIYHTDCETLSGKNQCKNIVFLYGDNNTMKRVGYFGGSTKTLTTMLRQLRKNGFELVNTMHDKESSTRYFASRYYLFQVTELVSGGFVYTIERALKEK